MRLFVAWVLTVSLGGFARAEEPKPAFPPLMTLPGKLLLSDDFKGSLSSDWKAAKGKWEPKEGALRGAELPADMHGAVIRRNLDMTDAIIQYSFKLDGGKSTTLSLNDTKGHVCRVSVRPNAFSVQKDDHDGKNGPDKVVVLNTVTTEIKTGAWHTLVIEMKGPEFLARLDGKFVAYGQHEQIKLAKTNLGLTVAGESVSFKELRVWSAEANPKWDPASLKNEKK